MNGLRLSALPERPLVTIVVPSYNQGQYIRATLDSILTQDYRPLQLLVVDGGSTDGTLDVLREYDDCAELTWISEPDGGPVDAVNKGFRQARGEICAVQSSDDFYLPHALARVVEEFRADAELALLYGDMVRVDAAGVETGRDVLAPFSLPGLLARDTFVPQPAAFFRTDAVRQLGGWDERLPYVPDTDFWMRIAFHGRVRKIDAFLAGCRAHAEQRDRQHGRIRSDYARMLEQSRDLRAAPLHLRRAARAGLELLSIRYHAEGATRAELTRAAWRAVLRRPRCLFSATLPKHLLLPGYFRMAAAVGGLRRAVVGR